MKYTAAAVTTAAAGTAAILAATAVAAPAPTPAAAQAPAATQPPPAAVTPRHGRPFAPTQGDWEGTTSGLGASFDLGFDPVSGRYTLMHFVLLRPNACPADPALHSEFFLSAGARAPLGPFGALRFGSDGVSTTLKGARVATVTSTYRVRTCAGTLTWRMHPARRVAVDDGRWTIRFGQGAPARFRVDSGGRLALGLPLPPVPKGCSGLRGSLDLFISATGRADITHGGVTMALRFTKRAATGTVRIAGCQAGSLPIRAARL